MARGLNKAMLIGNLGRDPEMRHTASGSAVCTFSMATNESWVKDGERQERTEWHNIVTWDKLAEICERYLSKGSKVYIEGRIQTRSWDDKTTGQKKYMTEIVADQMMMLDSPGGGRSGDSGPADQRHPSDEEYATDTLPDSDDYDDDLPF